MSVITVGLPAGYQLVYREDTDESTGKNPFSRPPAARLSRAAHRRLSKQRSQGSQPMRAPKARAPSVSEREARDDYRRISAAVSGVHPAETRSTAVCRSASLPARRSASGSGYPASISTCRRQLSTLARSVGAVAVISIKSDIVREVRAFLDEPFRAEVGRERHDEREDSSAETRSCA